MNQSSGYIRVARNHENANTMELSNKNKMDIGLDVNTGEALAGQMSETNTFCPVEQPNVQCDVAEAHLPLVKAGGGTLWAKLDAVDFDRVSAMGKWHAVIDGRTCYAVCFDLLPNGVLLRHHLHRMVTGAGTGFHVDHINGDGLDCRRSNLRLTTGAENAQNRRGANCNSRSGVRGVRWHERDQRWEAALKLDSRVISLGYYKEQGDAIAIVAEARRRLMPFSSEAQVTPILLTPEEVEHIVSTRIAKLIPTAS